MLDVDEIIAILRSTAARIDELARDATPHELEPAGYEDEWSITAVVAHLRACNDVLGGAMVRIIREDHPAWRATSPRTWQAKSGYHDWPFGPSFEAFTTGRDELLAVLEPLPPATWERTAAVTVPPAKVFERSTRYYGDWLAQHERTHVKDLERRRAWRDAGDRTA